MTPETAAKVEAMREMTVAELRAEYLAAFGKPSHSNNKTHLFRRIAWQLQALDEGGLSEAALARARELAKHADIRIRVPKGAFKVNRTTRTRRLAVTDPRLPMPGTVLTREHGARTYQVTVLEDGFEYEGAVYRSLTAVAKVITGSHWNGFLFFNLVKRPTRK